MARLLHLIKPVLQFVPEVATGAKQTTQNKLIYTGSALLAYLVLSQVHLYGALSSDADPLYFLRTLFASNRGTLMEFGVMPVITAGMIMHLLAGANLVEVDYNIREDRMLFGAAQKLLALLLTFVQAVLTVFSGAYGSPSELGAATCILLVAQLLFSGVIVVLLDEMLQKGYGFGSALNLFIATNVCETVIWQALSPQSVNSGRGSEFQGALLNLLHQFFTRSDKARALKDAFYRSNSANVTSVLTTVLVFGVIVYVQSLRIEIPVKSNKFRSHRVMYPIKLLYTSNMPILLQSALASNILLISQSLYSCFPDNIFVRLLGVWQPHEGTNNWHATSGLVYFLSAPQGLWSALLSPIQFVTYTAFVLGTCAFFARTWIELSGASAREVANELKEQQIVIAGFREGSMYQELKRIIPSAAVVGGVVVGLLSISADLLGVLSSGTGILLAVTTIYQYVELFAREQLSDNPNAMQMPNL
ncbi:hypothetical protein GQ42DRAFT_159902 [Ramicandelaber brevisporus]|nr:hypothetical protein GQ42DRAFT_159902 [Ramicandelaber brevisporus]